MPHEAGPSRAPPQKPKRTAKGANHAPGIVIPKKYCAWCVMWESLCQWDLDGCAWSCQQSRKLKKPCRRFEELVEKGKRRAEDEGEGEGASKRPRVGLMVSEQMEQRLRILRWGPELLKPFGLSTLA